MHATSDLLKHFKLFKSLRVSDLEELARECQVKRFARRAMILTAGKKEKYVCFLFEGRLQGIDFTIDGREVGIYFVSPGDFCGELCIFDEGNQPEHVIALNSSVVVLIPTNTLRDVANLHPKIMTALGNKLASRVRQMTLQRSFLGLPNIPQRVCNQLWLFAEQTPVNSVDKIEIINAPTHMEIAIMLNISRETVTRVFRQLQQGKIVSRDGPNNLLINEPEKLKQIADGKVVL